MRRTPTRRTILGLALAAIARPALAQAPRLARIIVGAAPGGGTDTVARLVAERLSGLYAPQVIVENRPGASSRLAAEAVKAAAPDGATILCCPMPVLALFPHVLPRTTRYDPLTDFTPVATIGELAYGFAVNAANPARDLADFVSAAKARGGATFAPAVLGAPQHMLGLQLARGAGLVLEVVTYRASTQALQDLIAGRIESYMSHMAELAPQLRDNRLRILAVSSEARLPGFPSVPTFAEQGFPELTAGEAYALVLPARAAEATVSALHGAVARATADQAFRERLARLEITPLVLSAEDTAARLRAEFAAWGPVVQASGFRAEE